MQNTTNSVTFPQNRPVTSYSTWHKLPRNEKDRTIENFTEKERTHFLAEALVVLFVGIPKASFKDRQEWIEICDSMIPIYANDLEKAEGFKKIRDMFAGNVEHYNDLDRVSDWPEEVE
jgi:hypothetical protein